MVEYLNRLEIPVEGHEILSVPSLARPDVVGMADSPRRSGLFWLQQHPHDDSAALPRRAAAYGGHEAREPRRSLAAASATARS